MKKTTVQYFCDRCEEEIPKTPQMQHTVRFTSGIACFTSCVDVDFTFNICGDKNSKENILCDKCKIEVLEELLKKLKGIQDE